MARIDHSFSVDKAPDAAQALFVRDIAPELASARGFQIKREEPGELVFSDGVEPGGGSEGLEESPQERAGEAAAPTTDRFVGNLGGSLESDDLSDVLARHLRVEFTAEGSGTQVRLHGHVERDLKHALSLLGTHEHWPATADRPHD